MNFKKVYCLIIKKKKNNGCFYFCGNFLDLGWCIGVYVLVLGYNKNFLINNIFFFLIVVVVVGLIFFFMGFLLV